MSKPARISGAWALITGASDGIGAAAVRGLAASPLGLGGVILVARRADRLTTLAAEIGKGYGLPTRTISTDLADPAAAGRILEMTADLDIGIAVLAAGFGSGGPFLDTDPDDEAAMVDVNCRAVVVLTRALAERMCSRGSGSIVLLSSLVAFQGVPHAATYAASKAFVQSFAEGIAPELGRNGVQVLAVAPGPVRSGFAQRAGMQLGPSDSAERVASGIVAAIGSGRRFLRPGPIGKLLGWSLASAPRALRVRIMGAIMGGMTSSPVRLRIGRGNRS